MNLTDTILTEYEGLEAPSGKKALILCGPTCSGKSGLAMNLAERADCEIVSADSMQIYRLMDVGTAKPTGEEQSKVRHHMIDVANPWENYNAFRYREEALREIEDVLSRGKIPVVCGGTGLYVNSLLDNRQFADNGEDCGFFREHGEESERADSYFQNGNTEELFAMLQAVDPEAASMIHPNNVKRVKRFLDLYYITGKVKSVRDAESVSLPGEISYLTYCLMPEREALYEKINRRVEEMFRQGLWDECGMVYGAVREHCPEDEVRSGEILKRTALAAIGYKELLPLLSYPETKAVCPPGYGPEEAKEAIKQDTRRYAKRQVTWFKRTPGVRFLEI